jgi:large subunit ribosomal protein L4
VRVAALKSALSLILKEGRLTIVDSIDLGEVKTKKLAGVLTTLQAGKKTLVVDDGGNQNLRLSIRNLEDKLFLPPEGVNVYDLLRHDHLVLSKGAVKALEARCLDKADGAEAKQ